MKLNEISGLISIDVGAPTPTIISNDSNLYIMFYAGRSDSNAEVLQERNSVYDKGIYILKFNLFLKYNFGIPGNEIIIGHPYAKLGLQSYAFYELEDSDWIKELMEIESVHPYFNKDKWIGYKHYILTFHDNMFECIARDFEIREKTTSIYEQASIITNEINVERL